MSVSIGKASLDKGDETAAVAVDLVTMRNSPRAKGKPDTNFQEIFDGEGGNHGQTTEQSEVSRDAMVPLEDTSTPYLERTHVKHEDQEAPRAETTFPTSIIHASDKQTEPKILVQTDGSNTLSAQSVAQSNMPASSKENAVKHPIAPHDFGWVTQGVEPSPATQFAPPPTSGRDASVQTKNAVPVNAIPMQGTKQMVPDTEAQALLGQQSILKQSKPSLNEPTPQQNSGPEKAKVAPPDIQTSGKTLEITGRPASNQTPTITASRPTNRTPQTSTKAVIDIQTKSQLQSIDPIAFSPADTTASTAMPHGADTVRSTIPAHIARQLAEIVQHMPSRPVEITLSPEELGRVRLSVTPGENSIVVNILAERGETLDLLRRHIDQLTQEFENLGYDDIGFSFTQTGAERSDDQSEKPADHDTQSNPTDLSLDASDSTHIHLTTSASSGLDLRL
jgi:flagellar hook-length control protein FliK